MLRARTESAYTWDSYGNFLTGSYADGTSTSFTWDSLGRLTSASDSAAGTLTRTWSSVRTYIDKYSSGSVVKGTVQPVWDVNGLPLKMTVLGPDNNSLLYSYGFDSAKRFSSESATNQSSSVSITYDTADRKYQETLPDGIVATYAYDNADELTSITYMNGTTSVGTLTYSYDGDGRVSTRGGTLFQAILPSGTALPTSATYNVDNRLTAWTTASGSTKPTYDANGNQICDNYNSSTSSCTGRTLTWDKRNRLTQVSSGGSTLASFTYDALSRRISVTSGGTTTATLYNTLFDPVQEQVGSTVTANIWTGLGVDERFARTTTAGTSTYLTDALGSTMSLASSAGAVQTSYGYDAAGNTTTSGTASTNSYEYTGRQNDSTGYYYYRARYYNPQTGRFIAEDPLGFGGGDANIYRHAGGDPINFMDPLGLSASSMAACFLKGGAAGALGALAAAEVALAATELGVPPVVTTWGLGAAGVAGAVGTGLDLNNQIVAGNWDGVAYDVGSVVGGGASGGFGGRRLAEGINGKPSPPWSPRSDASQVYNPRYPGGSLGQWASSGTNPGSAAGAAAGAGMGGAQVAPPSCGC